MSFARLCLSKPFSAPFCSSAVRSASKPSLVLLTRQSNPASSRSFHTTAMHKHQSRGQETEGVSEWKKRAPYRVHEPNEKFDVKYEANCHCGRVKYQLSRLEPLDSKLCHCTTCQTQHGKKPIQLLLDHVGADVAVQLHPSNGPPFSTRRTSTSPTVTMTSNGMIRQRNRSSTSFLARSAVRTVIRQSWTRAAT